MTAEPYYHAVPLVQKRRQAAQRQRAADPGLLSAVAMEMVEAIRRLEADNKRLREDLDRLRAEFDAYQSEG